MNPLLRILHPKLKHAKRATVMIVFSCGASGDKMLVVVHLVFRVAFGLRHEPSTAHGVAELSS